MYPIIRLITTEGCEGCNILRNLLYRAIEESGHENIVVEEIDCQDTKYTSFLKRYFINDFPTMVFIYDNNVLTKFVGTMTVSEIKYNINKWFYSHPC